MPVIRGEVSKGTNQSTKVRIREGVKKEVIDCPAAKEIINDYVAVCEYFW